MHPIHQFALLWATFWQYWLQETLPLAYKDKMKEHDTECR